MISCTVESTVQVYTQITEPTKMCTYTTFFDKNYCKNQYLQSWNLILGEADSDQLYSGVYSLSVHPNYWAKQDVCTTIFDKNYYDSCKLYCRVPIGQKLRPG